MKTLTTYRIIDKTIRLFFILSFFLRWSNKEGGSLEIGIKEEVRGRKTYENNHGEFDPGSERTLAARLKHASRTVRKELAPF